MDDADYVVTPRLCALIALAVAGMINTAACTGGLRMGGQGGAAASGGGIGHQGFTNTGGGAGNSVTLNIQPYAICPCGNTSNAAKLVEDPVVARKASPKFSREFEEIWSLEMGSRASNLANNAAHDVAVHDRDDRVRNQRSAATQARLCRGREAHSSRATQCRYGHHGQPDVGRLLEYQSAFQPMVLGPSGWRLRRGRCWRRRPRGPFILR